ncbi:MAG TPA: hypothetical protein PLS03_17450 [Terrimicrobiaceae bacterium]|nr:hypothetical protein [Terrimicrobiaceae bacterium]
MPQATVQLQKKPAASTSKSVSTSITVAPQTAPASGGDVSVAVGAIALVAALAALGVQVWMMLG